MNWTLGVRAVLRCRITDLALWPLQFPALYRKILLLLGTGLISLSLKFFSTTEFWIISVELKTPTMRQPFTFHSTLDSLSGNFYGSRTHPLKNVIFTARWCSSGFKTSRILQEMMDGIISWRWEGYPGILDGPRTRNGVRVAFTSQVCETLLAFWSSEIPGIILMLVFLILRDSTLDRTMMLSNGRNLSEIVTGRVFSVLLVLNVAKSRMIFEGCCWIIVGTSLIHAELWIVLVLNVLMELR